MTQFSRVAICVLDSHRYSIGTLISAVASCYAHVTFCATRELHTLLTRLTTPPPLPHRPHPRPAQSLFGIIFAVALFTSFAGAGMAGEALDKHLGSSNALKIAFG